MLHCEELEPSDYAGAPRRTATAAAVRASVVWLHGLGASGHDFVPIVPHLGLEPAAGVRFVFPHAPAIPVTINGGFVMPAWYDILEMSLERRVDEAGILRSTEQVRDLIARENERGVPCERIVLAGFSQGGAIALHAALRHPERLAGVVALSTYLVRAGALERERHDANRDLPVFQAHGTADPMVPFAGGERCRETLERLGHPVEWHAYRMQHEVCMEEIDDIGRFLAARLGSGPG